MKCLEQSMFARETFEDLKWSLTHSLFSLSFFFTAWMTIDLALLAPPSPNSHLHPSSLGIMQPEWWWPMVIVRVVTAAHSQHYHDNAEWEQCCLHPNCEKGIWLLLHPLLQFHKITKDGSFLSASSLLNFSFIAQSWCTIMHVFKELWIGSMPLWCWIQPAICWSKLEWQRGRGRVVGELKTIWLPGLTSTDRETHNRSIFRDWLSRFFLWVISPRSEQNMCWGTRMWQRSGSAGSSWTSPSGAFT